MQISYNQNVKNKFIFYLLYLAVFIFGIIVGSVFISKTAQKQLLEITRSPSKELTNPLLDCEITYFEETNVLKIKKEIEKVIGDYKDKYSDISVYYRDLNNGPWLGINEKNQFAPASLLKIPVLITYLKLAESDPNLLSEKINYNGVQSTFENVPPDKQMIKGLEYTVDQLVSRMTTLSDNVAFELLATRVDSKQLKTIHEELGIIYPDEGTPENYVSVKSYAGLFRVLYNSTYLSRKMSEKALNYLLKSDFNEGIRAGIPSNIKSALKYGITNPTIDNGLFQIHDCGIVYYPKKPYILCIMTQGKSKESLINLIKRISAIVYLQLISQ